MIGPMIVSMAETALRSETMKKAGTMIGPMIVSMAESKGGSLPQADPRVGKTMGGRVMDGRITGGLPVLATGAMMTQAAEIEHIMIEMTAADLSSAITEEQETEVTEMTRITEITEITENEAPQMIRRRAHACLLVNCHG